MSWSRSKPSLTSLVAFFLIVTPIVYVLSYAPVARVCQRTVETMEVPSGQRESDKSTIGGIGSIG